MYIGDNMEREGKNVGQRTDHAGTSYLAPDQLVTYYGRSFSKETVSCI